MDRSSLIEKTESSGVIVAGMSDHASVNSLLDNLRILIIDDEQAMLDAIRLFFQDDHDIITCDTAEKARKLFSAYDFDVVICDLKLGRDNGAALLTEFKALRPECERILMTGYTDMTALIRAINEASISYYLTKPIELLQLRMMIDRVVEHIRLRSHNTELVHRIQEHNLHLEKLVTLRNSELHRANDALNSLQESREQVIRMSVHDLQNPLNNLDSVLNELQKLCGDRADYLELLEIARHSSDVMRALVDDMLSIAVLSKSDVNLRTDVLDVGNLLRASARAFSGSAEKKNIWINVEVTSEAKDFVGDAIQLRKALDNLVSNAIKYTPVGGSITLTSHTDRDYLTIEVVDSGLGMTHEDIGLAFREFSRLSARPTGGETSTGLGLFIVRKIIELHGGDVSAKSDGSGMGTTFTVTLPLSH